MKNKLIELLQQADKKCNDTKQCENCIGFGQGNECVNHLIADHLLANGVIVPPCKAGDKAYHLTSVDTLDELNVAEIFEGKVSTVSIEDKVWIFCRYDNGLNFWYTEKDIGRNLFLTREEAEKALAERSEG